jgi:hypothetical protein
VAERIQRRRTKGWRAPEGAVYVGRPSRWGNFVRVGGLGADGQPYTAQQAVDLYRRATRFWTENELPLAPLRGHDLACWCPEACGEDVDLGWNEFGGPYDPCALPRGHSGHHDPSAPPYCHADVLLELANA